MYTFVKYREIALMVLLFYLIILPIYQDGLFDRVLKLRGLRHVLEKKHGNDVVKCMRGILVLILTLPLNLIPVLGQILYATINGWILTFGIRFHYDSEIRNISVAQSRREAWKRKKDYAGFGSIAVALEMIPFANLLFMWTNIVGCALWVADEIEKEERRQLQEQQNAQYGTMVTSESLADSSSPLSPQNDNARISSPIPSLQQQQQQPKGSFMKAPGQIV
ncbi:hypothetical protein BGX26_010673 [Mortierella sp. AD094]|nr:hypothetical protein BGX26_010673 [Mortierella sp. AD094]